MRNLQEIRFPWTGFGQSGANNSKLFFESKNTRLDVVINKKTKFEFSYLLSNFCKKLLILH
jgi:hypothetical protein